MSPLAMSWRRDAVGARTDLSKVIFPPCSHGGTAGNSKPATCRGGAFILRPFSRRGTAAIHGFLELARRSLQHGRGGGGGGCCAPPPPPPTFFFSPFLSPPRAPPPP